MASLASALQPQSGGLLQRLMGTSGQSGIGQRLTDLLDPRVALPMAGAMMAGSTPGESIGNAMTLGGFGLGKLGEGRKADAEKQRTMNYLNTKHPELAQMVDMGLPIEDAWSEALKLDNPAKKGLINAGDGNLYDQDNGQWITAPGSGGAGGMFDGKSVEAQGLNYLIQTGKITQEQAANMASGKTVTNPVDGSVMFLTAQGVFSQPAGGGSPQPLGAVAPSATGDPLVSPTGGNPGLIPVTGPKAVKETETQRNKKAAVDGAAKSLDSALTKWEALVTKTGMSAVPGQEQDDLIATRQGIMLEMKELYNLGVLNGPDLELMQNMIVDPVVDPSKGWWDMAKKGGSALGIGGDITTRAKNNVATLRKMIRQKRDAAFAATDGTAGGVPAPGGVDYKAKYGLD